MCLNKEYYNFHTKGRAVERSCQEQEVEEEFGP